MILIILLFNLLNGKDIEYKAEKLPLDTTVYYHILKLEETITLQENDSIIINRVNDIAFDTLYNRLILTEPTLKSALFFNYSDGSFCNNIKTNYNIQDSFIINNGKDYINFNKIKAEYMQSEDYIKNGLTESGLKLVNSTFNKISIYRNKYYFLTHMTIPSIYFDRSYKNALPNRPVLCVYNEELELLKVISLVQENNWEYFPMNNIITILNDTIYTDNYNHYAMLNINKVSKENIKEEYELLTISQHDLQGKKINHVGFLPNSLVNSYLNYSFVETQLTSLREKIYYAYQLDDYIYTLKNKIVFKFKNLPYYNLKGLDSLYRLIQIKSKDNLFVDYNEKAKLCQISMIKLLNRKDNLLVLFTVYEEEHSLKMYYILQEYTIEGDLLSQTYFDDNPENQIKNVFYDSKNDYLCFLRKSKKGWTVEKRSFK